MNNSDQTICIDGETYGVDQLVDCKVVARLIGLSHRTVEDMASRRELPMYKLAQRANRYRVREIIEWANAKREV
jgi:transketolase C-terminal domain/subunit